MTETRQELVTEAGKTGDRPLMIRMSPSQILRASTRISREDILALESAWPELGIYRAEPESQKRTMETSYPEPRPRTLRAS